jgi:putative two-component system hydrogenase maturation factor HypX/HoxX
VCRATLDGAVWIGQLRPTDDARHNFKQPAVLALGALARDLPELGSADLGEQGPAVVADEIRYEESGAVGYLHFQFYNGALSTAQCDRLRCAFAAARARATRVIVLMGGSDFWCNGMHLHCIEAAHSPGEESWANINRIDDLAHDILTTDSHITIAALQGNAAAGGVFLALATDRVLAHHGVILNPHYRNMGNLYGSEYWTYLLPRRVGNEPARQIMGSRLPMGAPEARSCGLIDECAAPDDGEFHDYVSRYANALAQDDQFPGALEAKRERRRRDETERALSSYRTDELECMRMNFFGFDPSYHIARHRFVHHTPHAWTPLHLAHHRRSGFLGQLLERRA